MGFNSYSLDLKAPGSLPGAFLCDTVRHGRLQSIRKTEVWLRSFVGRVFALQLPRPLFDFGAGTLDRLAGVHPCQRSRGNSVL